MNLLTDANSRECAYPMVSLTHFLLYTIHVMKFPSFSLVTSLLLVFGTSAMAEESKSSGVSITKQEDRLRIEVNGTLFTEYIFQGKERFFPLFYPVLGPGQVPMTRNYPLKAVEGEPTDHPHHQSLWFAHSDVNGHNFWAVQTHKDKVPGKTVHREFKEIVSGKDEGHFISENDYVAADGKIVMSDTRTVRFLTPANADAPRVLDITIAFHASHGPVRFGDDKDAGMAIRINPELQVEKRTGKGTSTIPAEGHLLNSEGVSGVETWGKRARWVDAYGQVGEKPVGVAIFDHPSNPGYPTYWHSRTYGLITANIFGKRFFEKLEDPKAGEVNLPAGKDLTFRWRFTFHEGDPTSADIEALFTKFAAE